MAAPLLPRVYDEDGDIGWNNRAHDISQRMLTESVYNKLLADQYKDIPDKSAWQLGGLDMKLKMRKIGLFSTSTKVSQGSKVSGLPRPVGGAGFAAVVNHPKFPDHEFFRPGRHFRVRLRHENLSFQDDAMLDGRVTCIKFCDDKEGGPLDLVLHTGRVAPYHNAAAFEEFLAAFSTGQETLKAWTLNMPAHYYGRVENARRTPESYSDLRYYSHVAYEFRSTDGLRHLARLRLLPADSRSETGLPDLQDQQNIWCTDRKEGETREPDYLRKEYVQRLRESPLQYRLQIQLKEWDEHIVGNPCKQWKQKNCPWLELAVITVALPLTERVLRKTRLSLTNHQPVFKLPECNGARDFFSLAHVMSNLHGQLAQAGDEQSTSETKVKYVVSVVTGEMANAGTDADVLITITGTKGRTNPINLDTAFHDDFEAGQTDVFEIEAVSVGEVVMVQMELRSVLPGRGWCLSYVSVTDVMAEKTVRCPCYQWLTSTQPSILLRRSEALLAQQEITPYCYLQRKYELEERRKLYQWQKEFGLPGRLKADRYEDIPREARLHRAKEWDLRVRYLQTLTNTGVGTLKSMFEEWDPLTDPTKLITNLLKDKKTVKMVSAHWKDDVEFGRQMLNGPHPMRIKRLTQPLINFPVTDEVVYGLLGRGMTLKDEIKAGHLYVVTYPELTKLVSAINHSPKARSFLADPVCLLYVRPTGQLVPIAIQLSQHAGANKLIFTPRDDQWEWLFAKMWVRLADAQIHQIEARHLKLHLVTEAVAVATMRNLPAVHPVYKLLVPHLRYTIAVNHLGRQVLYPADDGLFPKYLSVGSHYNYLLKETYRRFNFSDMDLSSNIEDRRVGDADLLPHYYYREDGLALWNIIKKFARTVLMLQYWTGQNVRTDEELQTWIHDLHTNGLPVWEDGTDHNIPKVIETLDQLIQLITTVIFTASAQNAALTAPMMDYYGFPPNAPTMLLELPPHAKGMVSMESLQRALPSRGKCAEIISVCYSLSRMSSDEWMCAEVDEGGSLLEQQTEESQEMCYLGEYPDDHFSGDAVLATIDAFREDLKNLSASVAARNEKLDFPYTYLQPERIPASVST